MLDMKYICFERKHFHVPDASEAIDLYQLVSKNNSKITLIGIGEEASLCLMLASRFQPDEIILSPFLTGDTLTGFLNRVKRECRFLFAVCAPITVYLPMDFEKNDIKLIGKLLNRTSSLAKKIEFFDSSLVHRNFLTNLCQRKKTLA